MRAPVRTRAPLAIVGVASLAVLVALMLPAPAAAGAPPLAIIDAPQDNAQFNVGQPINFSAVLSNDPDKNTSTYPLDFRWDFPNETIQGDNIRVILNYTNFTTPGTFVVRLTVTDDEALQGFDNVTLVIVSNDPPVAVIASPANGSTFFSTESIAFSAAGSFDPEGDPLTYSWLRNSTFVIGSGPSPSVRLQPGNHLITLRVSDEHGGVGEASIRVNVRVNTAPRLVAPAVAPLAGMDGDPFTFGVTYYEDNGEAPTSISLVLDGTSYPLQANGTQDVKLGRPYATTVSLAAGLYSFYVVASDGNLTNVSANITGPSVERAFALLSPDGHALVEGYLVPPENLTLTVVTPAPAPGGLVALTPAYSLQGTAVALRNLTLRVSFAPDLTVNRSTALVHQRSSNGTSWVGLVSQTEPLGNTASVALLAPFTPHIFAVFGSPRTSDPNLPPSFIVVYNGLAQPNETMTFAAGGASDPEGAGIDFAWRFEGPAVNTTWVPGRNVSLSFPRSGVYFVSLRGMDGAGNVVYRNSTINIAYPVELLVAPPDEGIVLASLAVGVLVSAVLAVWWRSRTPIPTRSYDDLYGRAYKSRMWDQREYAELFHRYADVDVSGAQPLEAPDDESE